MTRFLSFWYSLGEMWILLVVILSGPWQVDRLEILGSFHRFENCEREKKRAFDLGLPEKANIGCGKMEGVALTHGTHRAL